MNSYLWNVFRLRYSRSAAARLKAVQALRRGPSVDAERAVDTLVRALGDPDAEVRSWAAYALSASGGVEGTVHPNAVEPLLQALLARSTRGVVFAIAGVRDVRVVALLADIIKKGTPDLRAAAAESLGKSGSADAVGPLTAALDDESVDVVRATGHALGQLGNLDAIPVLTRALSKGQEKGGAGAAGGLEKLHAYRPLLLALVDSDHSTRSSVKWHFDAWPELVRIPVHREHSFRFNVNTDSADGERRFRSS